MYLKIICINNIQEFTGMKNKIISIRTALFGLALISFNALAGAVVPEIDGGSAAIALGLTIAVVALIRDKFRNKYY
jgi:hypothetical protein